MHTKIKLYYKKDNRLRYLSLNDDIHGIYGTCLLTSIHRIAVMYVGSERVSTVGSASRLAFGSSLVGFLG